MIIIKIDNEIIINDYYLINKLQKDIRYNQIVFEMKENIYNFLYNINNNYIYMKYDIYMQIIIIILIIILIK